MIIDADLAVVIDMHPTPDFKKAPARDDGYVERFADFWRDLAGRFADLPVGRVVFEILNPLTFGRLAALILIALGILLLHRQGV